MHYDTTHKILQYSVFGLTTDPQGLLHRGVCKKRICVTARRYKTKPQAAPPPPPFLHWNHKCPTPAPLQHVMHITVGATENVTTTETCNGIAYIPQAQ